MGFFKKLFGMGENRKEDNVRPVEPEQKKGLADDQAASVQNKNNELKVEVYNVLHITGTFNQEQTIEFMTRVAKTALSSAKEKYGDRLGFKNIAVRLDMNAIIFECLLNDDQIKKYEIDEYLNNICQNASGNIYREIAKKQGLVRVRPR